MPLWTIVEGCRQVCLLAKTHTGELVQKKKGVCAGGDCWPSFYTVDPGENGPGWSSRVVMVSCLFSARPLLRGGGRGRVSPWKPLVRQTTNSKDAPQLVLTEQFQKSDSPNVGTPIVGSLFIWFWCERNTNISYTLTYVLHQQCSVTTSLCWKLTNILLVFSLGTRDGECDIYSVNYFGWLSSWGVVWADGGT